ncbi:hypothetical protein TUBRATIS_21960 [Tubulinosema ratisbonensis]|uniref:Uncharacterized protein n=1 Tax=Tubulinosema ratisbonensis TaxID=291195 RepID=A0A437AJM4_9MICR|nr:hypothetical protein TUBRATIS_21960 [Tubulinosema ratisbonensis]
MISLLSCFTFINMSCDRIEKKNLHSRLLPEWKRNNTKRHDERINTRDKLLPSTSLTRPDSSITSGKSDVKKLDEPTISEEDANVDEDEVLIIKDFCNPENSSLKRKILKDDSESRPALKSTKHEERFYKFKEFTPQKNSVTSYKISKKTPKESKQTKIPI